MPTVDMLEAKIHLSKLVASLESGQETEIIIARDGRPAARLVPLKPLGSGQRIGVAEGKYVILADIDEDNDLIADLFEGKAR
jgi:antitoxin (DNA-binding transcriptional repressor) of toxin-antitoxin stability system